MRVLITGPDNTPYDSGVFLFDVHVPDSYPQSPPEMKYITHGGRRFNPNLYACGKVCLSLLGTWQGQTSEKWNDKTSTLQQLFISVQSQILIETPYFNEPGHESYMNTASGIKASSDYNNDIRYFTMCHAMCDILEHPDQYPGFEEIINNHFKLKKDYILATCQEWTNKGVTHNYKQTFDKLKGLLEKLT